MTRQFDFAASPSATTRQAAVTFYNRSPHPPVLEIHTAADQVQRAPFLAVSGGGRLPGEHCWRAHPAVPVSGDWRFRIQLGFDTYAAPHAAGSFDYYTTPLHALWIQHGQIYDYEPEPMHVESRVVKITHFHGRLRRRALYIYLPRGYDQHVNRRYPVLYMHDGQNCFQSYAQDSYAGSWSAEQAADRLIAAGQMRECVIVGVANGGPGRIAEYLPPYISYIRPPDEEGRGFRPLHGRADETFAYYRDDVVPFVRRFYRTLTGREHTATCGSSMGGLFSTYIAWEHSDFARHHAALSPSFWITQHDGRLEMIERLRHGAPRDIRIWLDSGTRTGPDFGTDGMHDTIAARDALYANGYVEGQTVRYFLDEGALHNEAAWSARLDRVFRFLFPPA